MTLNPELTGLRQPIGLSNEMFLLSRGGISCEISSPGLESLSGEGTLILTSTRLIFLRSETKLFSKSNIQFASFAFALRNLTSEKFNQPIFGCNYLSGYENGISFKFYFTKGGAGVFLPAFSRSIHSTRTRMAQEREETERREENERLLEQVKNLAAVDPSDPSVVYIVQPH